MSISYTRSVLSLVRTRVHDVSLRPEDLDKRDETYDPKEAGLHGAQPDCLGRV